MTAPRALTLCTLLAAGLAQAGPPDTAMRTGEPCAVTGISRDIDSSGLRVRAAPDLRSPVLGLLHPGMDPEVFYHEERPTLADGLVGAQFTITAVRGDWLLIADVDPVTDGLGPDGGLEGPKNFQGVGWVHASRVDLLQDGEPTARARADRKAPVALPIVNLRRAKVVDCRGNWAKVRIGGREGWLPSGDNKARVKIISAALARSSAN